MPAEPTSASTPDPPLTAAGAVPAGAMPAGAVPAGATPAPRLARPVWWALTGPHVDVARQAHDPEGQVLAARYEPEVSPFAAVGEIGDPAGWDALGTIVDPGEVVVVMLPSDAAVHPWPPPGWKIGAEIPGLQMVARTMTPVDDPHLVGLRPADVPEMMELVERTRPGPFERRTIELGGYCGVRVDGRLVAMAGRRFAPGGFVEISAVCTDSRVRGQGLGGRLVRAVAAGIVAEGDVPFLHVAAANTGAVRLYEQLGMSVCRTVTFVALQRSPYPGGDAAART